MTNVDVVVNTARSIWAAPKLRGIAAGPWACFIEPEAVLNGTEILGTIFVGFGSYMNAGGFIRSHVEIGRYCSIGRDVNIGLGVHRVENFSTSPFFNIKSEPQSSSLASVDPKRRVIIGNDVWIGDRAMVASGVTIGDGAIIAAASVVTKDVPAYSIVGGVPAKPIKWRFEEETRDRLVALRWWEIEPSSLRALVDEDLEASLDRLESADVDRLPVKYRRIAGQ